MVKRSLRFSRSFRPMGFLGVLCACAVLSAGAAGAGQDDAAAPAGATEAAAIDGRNLFANTCGFCHHKGGRKAGKGPKLSASKRSDEYLFKRIQKGKTGKMPGFGSAFSEDEIWAIVAYIRGLKDE